MTPDIAQLKEAAANFAAVIRAPAHDNDWWRAKGHYECAVYDPSAILSIIAALEAAEGKADKYEKALTWYANPEIYKPHPHGAAFDNRDLSYTAKSALGDTP